MELTGHSGEVFACRFDPTGQYIASGSMDRSICQSRARINLVVCADQLQYSGAVLALAKTMAFSPDTSRQYLICTGRATRKCCSLRLRTCIWRVGTWRLERGYAGILVTRR
jgi:hypothetical protein